MSAYTDAWAKATPETPAGFLLRMAGYEVTQMCREKVERDVAYRDVVYRAGLKQIMYSAGTDSPDWAAFCAAYAELWKKED